MTFKWVLKSCYFSSAGEFTFLNSLTYLCPKRLCLKWCRSEEQARVGWNSRGSRQLCYIAASFSILLLALLVTLCVRRHAGCRLWNSTYGEKTLANPSVSSLWWHSRLTRPSSKLYTRIVHHSCTSLEGGKMCRSVVVQTLRWTCIIYMKGTVCYLEGSPCLHFGFLRMYGQGRYPLQQELARM